MKQLKDIFGRKTSIWLSLSIILVTIALLVCCVLNVMAATMPAWFSLRKPIVESMMIKK